MFVRWGVKHVSLVFVLQTVLNRAVLFRRCFSNYTWMIYNVSLKFNCSGIGGYIGISFINHLCYAYDLCLISLSSSGMQHLLNICKEYASTHNFLYNGSKSIALYFNKNTLKVSSPSFYLDQMKIPIVDQCIYISWHNNFYKQF